MYSKYAGTELEFNGSKHLILKDDDIVGILESNDAKELKPLNDRVLIKVCYIFKVHYPCMYFYEMCIVEYSQG